MEKRVYWSDIPADILYNFKLHCGYDECSIPEQNSQHPFDRYLEVAEEELKLFHCIRTSGGEYVFESEAHYDWFLLRWA